MTKSIQKTEDVASEIKAIITEYEFSSRWSMLECWHAVGQKIIETKADIGNLAIELGRSERTLEYAVQFARKFPKLEEVPEGKSISWRKITQHYLPTAKKEKEEHSHIWEIRCKVCGTKKED